MYLFAVMLASQSSSVAPSPETLISDPVGVLTVLLATLAAILWTADRPRLGRLFRIVPPLVLCYFIPTALAEGGIIPTACGLYEWTKQFLLPASLVLLTLSLDVRGIVRLGPRAGLMFLAGALGVVLGGPVALLIWQRCLPAEAWRAMSYLAGSWIGGSANGVALSRSFGAEDAALGPLIVVDAALANLWLGILLYLAGRRTRVDAWLRADASAIDRLEAGLAGRRGTIARTPSIVDWLGILTAAFGGAWLGHIGGQAVVDLPIMNGSQQYLGPFAWKVILATTFGVVLSFTPARSLEAAGAARIGTLLIYLLVACIGAGADFGKLIHGEAGYFLAVGATWMLVHAIVIFAVARLTSSPFFFLAVGSQASIGGVASAPLVAAAFGPSLAPVGVLLAIAGYVLGTYAGLLCATICRALAGA